MGTLYIVATPIGNLKDISFRALETLRDVDLILAEDTRMTKKLLHHYGVSVPIRRCDEHAGPRVYDDAADFLEKGKSIALVSDAGTPGISDPGARLIEFLRSRIPEMKIVPIPGSSALVAALSASGLNADRFTFLGYPPHKKGRQKFFGEMIGVKVRPMVLYESPHRLQKTLESLSEVFGGDREIVVARELTKIYEEIWKGKVEEARNHFTGEKGRGEFVLIIP
ncbi:16S rRNA (cytidine(1402)-2'-O)-methyltransferase [Candidatus Jorgensenbacteria bacterium GWA1_49_17]|uniref:Ribosomal RNA small subunit methyltransferase I n=2 Tax=Candidatus Joergenseniibacteriota TaxID=1752739 RepID=A0A1F6BQH7_9BACT|nr:MAG: 16S rRNA (cytidine(1402)-2'-O)-methyltransferase [Candidatus Jorgensenbacteria bacterium GWC1_48_12]OGG40047.1 MAG: 16S rRNA (cytidine(1402)-2'-O)-methyltransferase [Candidatus Jorgensenbacteria bacterium GWA1_49_17]